VCLGIPPYRRLNAWTNLHETWYGTWAHLNGVLHKSFPSVCVSVCVSLLSLQGNGSVKCVPPFGARQRLGRHVPVATNTGNNRRIAGRVIFYVVHFLPRESPWACLCIPLSLLGNNSVETFPRQRRIIGDLVFCADRVVSKESRRLVPLRTSCLS
jgi:hypothetical protein